MVSFIDGNWLKPLRRALPILEIVRKLEYIEFPDQRIILSENEKIEHYYFLLEGVVSCEKHRDSSESNQRRRFAREIVGPKQLG